MLLVPKPVKASAIFFLILHFHSWQKRSAEEIHQSLPCPNLPKYRGSEWGQHWAKGICRGPKVPLVSPFQLPPPQTKHLQITELSVPSS